MIDLRLLAAILLAAAAAWSCGRFVRSRTEAPVPGDPLLWAGLAGLVGGRIAAVALDDPGSLLRLRDLMLVRSGVELWPGLAVGACTFLVMTRRSGFGVAKRLAVAAPIFLAGHAGYEASCVFRDGCFGPPSALGFAPPGFAAPVFPVGLAVAAVVAAAAVALRRVGRPDASTAIHAVLVLALSRSVAGFHLPRVGDGLSRPHLESIAVTILAAGAAATHLVRVARARPTTPSRTAGADGSE